MLYYQLSTSFFIKTKNNDVPITTMNDRSRKKRTASISNHGHGHGHGHGRIITSAFLPKEMILNIIHTTW